MSDTSPVMYGATSAPEIDPEPFNWPVSFSTIGANGRTTETSRPVKRKSPVIGLFLGSGLIRADNITCPSFPPSKSNFASTRLGLRLLVNLNA